MRIALAQINTTVGDFAGNAARIRDAARRADADLVVFPELSVCGYMPRDLLREDAFLDACERSLDALAAAPGLPPLVVGAPLRFPGGDKPLCNAAVLLRDGGRTVVAKRLLPTYDVFDERRYFRTGTQAEVVTIAGVPVGITVCEDLWNNEFYGADPVADLVAGGARVVVNLSASPFTRTKAQARRALVMGHAREHGVPIALCNLVGANDQLVFDGCSFAVDATGGLCATAPAFREDLVVTDFTGRAEAADGSVRDAVVTGLRDYFAKTGNADAIVGMSGGIDSSLVACLAVEALGAAHVTGVGMPGPYSADYSLEDARTLARTLGIAFHAVPIREPYEVLRRTLAEVWGPRPFGIAEENLQARVRGTILMSLANKLGAIVLVPSNKSELAMGYCTLYGDMVGGLAPISDLYKTEVYELAREFPIPPRVVARPPSAELAPGQTDLDTLPPYDELDAILRLHLEERMPPAAIVGQGHDADVVARVLRTVARMEFKRQQGAPVLKVSGKAFGLGRRYPIVERFGGGAP